MKKIKKKISFINLYLMNFFLDCLILKKTIFNFISLVLFKYLKLNIVFLSIKQSKKIHKKYKKKKSLNILTFLYKKEKIIFSDILLCYNRIIIECYYTGNNFLSYITYLIIHGILHLQYYTHNNFINFLKMQNIKNKVFNKININ